MAIHQGQLEVSSEGFTQIEYFIYSGLTYSQESVIPLVSDIKKYFGVNAYQDINHIVIKLSDLELSLTSSPTDSMNSKLKLYTAESIATALILKIMKVEPNNQLASIQVEKFSTEFTDINSKQYRVDSFVIDFYRGIEYEYNFGSEVGEMINTDALLSPNDF